MNTGHLVHDDRQIRCKTCGNCFEISRRVLSDPMALMQAKESIASRHFCRKRPEFKTIRVWRSATGADLVPYWNDAMRRLMPAQS